MPAAAILPFLPLIGQGVGQIAQAIGGSRRAKREGDLYRDLQESGERDAKRLERERKGMYELGPTMRKYMQYAMEDPQADLLRKQEERRAAEGVGALTAGGARALIGGLSGQQTASADRMSQISADEYTRRQSATQNVGRMEEMLRREQRGDIGADLGLARGQAAAGMAGAFKADQLRREVGTNFLSGLAGLTGQAAGMGAFGGGSAAENFNNADPATQAFFMDPENQAMLRSIPFMKKGGRVKKTPGEFSHASNPINVMQDGAKIGELTGGEYVLNPQQAAAIARQSDIARKLFRKFDKEA